MRSLYNKMLFPALSLINMHKVDKHTIKRLLGFLLVGLYIFIAMLNSTLVQSFLGAWAGSYFSEEWGGKVRIGALHFSPVSHLILDDIELISPTNDTIFVGENITCRFKRFPVSATSLKLDRVRITDASYHFASIRGEDGHRHINLQFILDYFCSDKPKDRTHTGPFSVEVGELVLRNVDYRQDLSSSHTSEYAHGVSIPHMRYNGTSARFRKVHVIGDSITCRVVSLATTEASGLHVKDLSMDVTVSPHIIQALNMDLETDDSRLMCDARLEYDGWEEMSDYCEKVMMDLVLKEGTEVNLCEAAYWAPSLWGINCKVSPRGHCYGPVADLHADDFFATFGRDSYVMLTGRITGLPYIQRTTIQARVDHLHTTYADLAAVQHPGNVKMAAEKLMSQLNVIDGELMLDGGGSDCMAQFDLTTSLGDIAGHAAVQYESVQHNAYYVGEVSSNSLGINSMVSNEWVSRTGFHLTFQGSGIDLASLEASVDGRLFETQLRDRRLNQATLSASFDHQQLSADVLLNDSVLGLDVSATADLASHSYTLDAIVEHLHLTDLGWVETDSSLSLSTHLRADLQGEDLESMTGTFTAGQVNCRYGSREIPLHNINVTSRISNAYKNLALHSDWMTLTVKGYFQYADLPLAVRDFCNRYIPAYYNPYRKKSAIDMAPLLDDAIDLNLYWNDEQLVFAEAFPHLRLAPGTTLHVNYNAAEQLKMVFRSDSVGYGNVVLNDVGFNSNAAGSSYQVRMKAGDISVGSMPLVENLLLNASLAGYISTLDLRWDDDAATVNNQGDLEFFLTSTDDDNRISITKPTMYIMGQEWNIVCSDGILANRERVLVDNLRIYGLDQSLVMKAKLAHRDDDIVKLAFDDFSLDRICNLLLVNKKLSLQGSLDGQFSIRGMNSTPYYDANLVIDSCVVNGQPLGRVNARSNWETSENTLYVDLVSQLGGVSSHERPLELHGTMQMARGGSKMDFYADLDNISLQTAGAAISTFSSNISGSLGGNLHLYGTPDAPQLDGQLMISDGLLQVDATGVTYYFNDQLHITNDTLFLRDFAIHDAQGNYALANGILAYVGDDLLLDLGISSSRLLVLDSKSDGSNYYGTVLASLKGKVSGSVSHPAIRANASTLDGSTLWVPIDDSKQMSESDFVHFVSDKPSAARNRRKPTASGGSMDLQVDAAITPGLTLQLPMDFTGMSVSVTAVGRGDVHLVQQGGSPLSLLGDYEFTSGNFKLAVPLMSRDFAIQQGSSLNFPGALADARFDISAAYNQRVNIAGLMGTSGEVGADAYVQVQNVIKLAGTMQDPQISFDIQLPNVEQSVSDEVFAYIDRTNEREMLNQTVSLLLLGKFATENSIETESNFITAGNSFNVISSSLSNVVSNMVKVVDVNFKYQAGTVANTGQFDVGISKEWKKFYFESTFGYGNTNTSEADQTNVLVGDVVAGYRVTPYFHFYGFHRDNNSYYTRTELPYKQGVGVKLTKSFNTLNDLFPWLRRKSKNNAAGSRPTLNPKF